MPGNRALFDRAMEGNRHAVERVDWPHALKEAVRAVQEFPTDLDARSALAVALYHSGKYAQAAQLLQDLCKRRGDDPLTLGYLARAYEGNSQLEEAVATFGVLAEQALRHRRDHDALAAWNEAVRLMPEREELRIRVAELLVAQGNTQGAAEHCLQIARTRQASGDLAGALEAVDEALGLDQGNRAATALRSQLLHASTVAQGAAGRGSAGKADPAHGSGPLHDQASQIDHLVATATQQQATGDSIGALASYEQVLALGVQRGDVDYSLGLLLQERGEHERAGTLLRRAAAHQEYGLSAHFALAQSLQAQGKLGEAAAEFEAAIALVDLETVGRAEADDLTTMYEAAVACHTERGDLSRAASLLESLATVLESKRWGRELAAQLKARARELGERAMFAKLRKIGTGMLGAPSNTLEDAAPIREDSTLPAAELPSSQIWGMVPSPTGWLREGKDVEPTLEDAPVFDPFATLELPDLGPANWPPVTPIATEGCTEAVAHYVAASGRLLEQGLTYAAVDACHEVIRCDPEFLPIHLRLGEIYEREGRGEEALLKYRTLVDIWVAREQEVAAVDVYFRLIELSNDTLSARAHLAELLRKAGRETDAVTQGLMVASTLFKMGQTNRALEEFRRLLQWAPQSVAVHKEYGHVLFKLERWEAALQEFRRAAQLNTSDPVALALLNLTMAVLGTQPRAIWDSLAALIERLRAEPQAFAPVQAEYRAALLVTEDALLHYLLGVLQQACQQHAAAVHEFEQALGLLKRAEHPLVNAMLVHQMLTDSFLALNQSEAASRHLQAVQQLGGVQFPVHAQHAFARPWIEGEFRRRLAAAFLGKQDYDAALRELKRCVQLDPLNFANYRQLADLFVRRGDLAQALAQYERLAQLFESRQQLDAAIAALEAAVNLSPTATPIRSRLASLLIRGGLLERGLQELQEVARQHRQAGQPKAAVAAMQQAVEVYWKLGQHDPVFRIYDQILAIVPADLEIRQQLVKLLMLAGRHDGAVREQRRVVQIAEEQGNLQVAIAGLHQLISLQPAEPLAYEQLGDLLMRNKHYEQAMGLYKRLLRMRPGDEHVQGLVTAAERMLKVQGKQAA